MIIVQLDEKYLPCLFLPAYAGVAAPGYGYAGHPLGASYTSVVQHTAAPVVHKAVHAAPITTGYAGFAAPAFGAVKSFGVAAPAYAGYGYGGLAAPAYGFGGLAHSKVIY